MFGSIKKTMVAGAAIAVGVLAAPAVASAATAVPALPAGATQAAVSLTSNGPRVAGSAAASGALTLTSASTGVTVTCTVSATIDFDVLGTTLVRGITFTPTPCPTSIPGCFATAATSPAPNNEWGNRVITWPGTSGAPSGTYDIVNVSFQNTFSGTCGPIPTGVPFTETGVVWFRIGAFGGGAAITSAVPTAPNNIVTNPSLGNATITGSMSVSSSPALFPTM